MSDPDSLVNASGSSEGDPNGTQDVVNQLTKQLSEIGIDNVEMADKDKIVQEITWPNTAAENDEFLKMAGFDPTEFQDSNVALSLNDSKQSNYAPVPPHESGVDYDQKQRSLEWNNFVKQFEEMQSVNAMTPAVSGFGLENNAIYNDDIVQDIEWWYSKLRPMPVSGGTAPNASLESSQKHPGSFSSVHEQYGIWAHATGSDLLLEKLPNNLRELESLSIWMAGQIQTNLEQDVTYNPPFSPKCHPYHPCWLPRHSTNTQIKKKWAELHGPK